MHPVRHALHFIVILLAVFLWPGQIPLSDANDGFSRDLIGGKTFMVFCKGKHDTDLGVCNGYIMAVAEAMTSEQPVFGQRACGHAGIKAQQLVDLVRMDLAENADLSNHPAGVMVASILARQFPCYDNYEPAAGSRDVMVEPLSAPAQ
ncbi:MAG: Rap1a/Tai family immunity protein [Micavibrio sp.]